MAEGEGRGAFGEEVCFGSGSGGMAAEGALAVGIGLSCSAPLGTVVEMVMSGYPFGMLGAEVEQGIEGNQGGCQNIRCWLEEVFSVEVRGG